MPRQQQYSKKTNYSFGKGLSLFLNRSRHPPFCCEGAPAFRRGEESQLSFFHITRNVVLLEI